MNQKQAKKLKKEARRIAVSTVQKMMLEIKNWPFKRRFKLAWKILLKK